MTYPNKLSLTFTVDGNSVVNVVKDGNIRITSKLGQRVDTCKFTLEDPTVTPADWDEVIISSGGTTYFGGYITDYEEYRDKEKSLKLQYKINASDYSVLFEKVIVKQEYLNKTDQYIIQDIVSDNSQLSVFNSTDNVDAIQTWDRVRFNRKTFFEVMDQLADAANAYWYVDYDKNIIFKASEDIAAPFDLSDSPDLATSFPYDNLVVYKDGSNAVNRVEIVGGSGLSDDEISYLAGTGESNRIILPFKYQEPTTNTAIGVARNDGTEETPSWTDMTVAVGYIDELSTTDTVLYYYQEKVLEQTDSWPNLPNAVRLTGRYEYPVRVLRDDAASVTHYGRYLDGKLVDTSLVSKDTAQLAAAAFLAKYALGTTALSLSTQEPGLLSGQFVRVVNALQSIDADYLIHQVTTEIIASGHVYCDVELGTYQRDLIDMILRLTRNTSNYVVFRDDEVLDVITSNAATIFIGESSSASSTNVYKWGVDDDDFPWSFGRWGVVLYPDPPENRLTEAGETRLTEDDEIRLTE